MALRIRPRESASMLVSIAIVVGVVTLFSSGASLYLADQGTRGVQTGIGERAGADLALRVSLALAGNGEQQNAEVREAIANSFDPTGVRFAVSRILTSHVTVLPLSDDPEEVERGGSAVSYDNLGDRLDFVDGSAPEGQSEVAVQADAAKALGLEVAEQLLIAGEKFTISGTWLPSDPQAAYWYGDTMITTGFDDDFGPFVINENAWGRLDENPTATWTLVPDTAGLDSANIASVIDAWTAVPRDWRGTVSSTQTLVAQNRFVLSLRELDARLDGLRAVEPVAFTVLAAVGIIVLAELVRLLALVRQRRSELYWARGDSNRRISFRTARDVVAAGAVGFAIAITGIVIAAGTPPLLGVVPPAVLLVLSAAFAVVSTRNVGGVDSTRSVARRLQRGRRATLPGAVILLALAAGVSVWQLRLYGSPLTPTVGGAGGVDPIAVIAPAAALVASVLLIVALFPVIAVLLERRSTASVVGQLAARGLVRRIAVVSAPLIVVALATGTAVTAAGYSATWNAAFDETAALRTGSDLRLSASPDGFTTDAQDAAARVAGDAAVAPLEIQPTSIAGEQVSLLAVTPESLESIAGAVAGSFDPIAAADAIRVDIPAPEVPADTRSLSLSVTAEGFVTEPTVSLWVVNPAGFLRSVAIPRAGAEGDALTYESRDWQPGVPGPWSISAIDISYPGQTFDDGEAEFTMTKLVVADANGTETSIDLRGYWLGDDPLGDGAPANTAGGKPGFSQYADADSARLTQSLSGKFEDRASVPILISQELATLLTVEKGDVVAFSLKDSYDRLNGIVEGVLPAIPGVPTEAAIAVDLGVVQHFQLRLTPVPDAVRDLWVASDSPRAMADELRAALPSSVRIQSRVDPASREVLGSAAVVLWAAAAAALLLAIVCVVASTRSRLRSGRNDLGVLRALGLTGRDQAAIVTREFTTVLLFGVVGGAIAGAAVCALTIPYFARAAVTLPYLAIATSFRLDVVGLAILLVVLIAALAITVLAFARTVRSIARHAMPSEDSE